MRNEKRQQERRKKQAKKGPKKPCRPTQRRAPTKQALAKKVEALERAQSEREMADGMTAAKDLHFHPARWAYDESAGHRSCAYLVDDGGNATSYLMRVYAHEDQWHAVVIEVTAAPAHPPLPAWKIVLQDEVKDVAAGLQACMVYVMQLGTAYFEGVMSNQERFKAFVQVVTKATARKGQG